MKPEPRRSRKDYHQCIIFDEKRKKNTEKVKKWRQQLKQNVVKCEEVKKKDRERKARERKLAREGIGNNTTKQEISRMKKMMEMRRYRAKKKAGGKSDEIGREGGIKIAKMKNQRKRKLKERSRKEKLKEEKQKAIKRTQLWRLRVKMKEMGENEDGNKHNPEDSSEEKPGTSFSSYSTKRRKIINIKKQLPQTPSKRAEILETLAKSPSTSKILERKGIFIPNAKKKLDAANSLMDNLKSNLDETRGVGKKQSMAHKLLANSLKRSCNKNTCFKKYFKLRSGCLINRKWWVLNERKRRRDRISEETKEHVQNFYLSTDISREVPNKRDVKKVKAEDGSSQYVQKQVMTLTLAEAYDLYKERYPERKIGFTMFWKMKPSNVMKISETSRRTCLCQVCCNVALKLEGLKKHLKKIETPQNKTLLQEIKTDKKTIAALTLCTSDTQTAMACLSRECNKCGVEALSKHLQAITDISSDKPISWYHWEQVSIEKDNATKRCTSCVLKETTFEDYVKALEQNMMTYPAHVFRATWQQKQMRICLENLEPGQLMMVMDFSENYSCTFQSEAQSGFFDRNTVTVHPVMTYYVQPGEMEGSHTLVKHSIIGITEDTKHDADAVKVFEDEVIQMVSEKEGIQVDRIDQWTDGCAAQYKGRKAFADISLRGSENLHVQRNFFETSHGKNVCDGLGATVKNSCYQAVISERSVIANAHDVFEHCQTKLARPSQKTKKGETSFVSKREFMYVTAITRDRPENNVTTLKGTRSLHCLQATGGPYKVKTRNLSCYCSCCIKGDPDCINSEYCLPWESHILKPTRKTCEKEVGETAPAHRHHDDTVGLAELEDVNDRNSVDEHLSADEKAKHVTVGSFVAVSLKSDAKGPCHIYMAEVLSVLPEEDEIHVKYMKKTGSNMYQWAEEPEESYEPVDHVVCSLSPPKLLNERGQFRFCIDEMQSIRRQFKKNAQTIYFN